MTGEHRADHARGVVDGQRRLRHDEYGAVAERQRLHLVGVLDCKPELAHTAVDRERRGNGFLGRQP